MEVSRRVENGVVVFDEEAAFPEGTRVVVIGLSPNDRQAPLVKKPIELPRA